MPYKTGTWGEQAKARNVRRREYFRNRQRQKYNRKPWHPKSPDYQKEYDKIRNPEKVKARSQARYRIAIPEGQLCEECGIRPAKHRHHPDYTKPLEVKFLCVSCNKKAESR